MEMMIMRIMSMIIVLMIMMMHHDGDHNDARDHSWKQSQDDNSRRWVGAGLEMMIIVIVVIMIIWRVNIKLSQWAPTES